MGVIQIRGVSDEAHRRLKDKAAEEGLSLSDYLRQELEEIARGMTLLEWRAWVASREPGTGVSGAELLREAREERARQLDDRH